MTVRYKSYKVYLNLTEYHVLPDSDEDDGDNDGITIIDPSNNTG